MIDATIAGAQWLGDEGMAVIMFVVFVAGVVFATNRNPS